MNRLQNRKPGYFLESTSSIFSTNQILKTSCSPPWLTLCSRRQFPMDTPVKTSLVNNCIVIEISL